MLRPRDASLHAGAFCVLLAGMTAINADVRRHMVNLVAGDSSTELATIGAPLADAVRVAIKTVGTYDDSQTPLLVFGVAAVLLVGFMLRS